VRRRSAPRTVCTVRTGETPAAERLFHFVGPLVKIEEVAVGNKQPSHAETG